jgi:putative transcriptional regulator
MNLTNQFLVAMPKLSGTSFHEAVVLIFQHSDAGSTGVVLNQCVDAGLEEVFTHLKVPISAGALGGRTRVLSGGPAERQKGFVLHSPVGNWRTSVRISDELAITSSKDLLFAMASKKGPSKAQLVLGCAKWDAGQLEAEIMENAWLTVPANLGVIFETPILDRWNEAAAGIGVQNMRVMSQLVGHSV